MARIRGDFPILAQRVHGHPLVYLDNANTTQKPRAVLDALTRYYAEDNANVHRSTHLLSERATRAYEAARVRVQQLINAPEAREIILTRLFGPPLNDSIAGEPAAPSKGQTASVTLRFVSWKPDHPQVWDETLAEFTKTHPHISIVRELAPHSSTAYHDLLTQKLKNRDAMVDVFFMDVIWAPEFAEAGWAQRLDERFTPAMREEFLPATVEVGRYADHLYGVPSCIDVGQLYYRSDLLAKYGFTPPTTWDELARQADAIVTGERSDHHRLRCGSPMAG